MPVRTRSKLYICVQRDLEFESQVAEKQTGRFIRLHPDIKHNYFGELSKRDFVYPLFSLLGCFLTVFQGQSVRRVAIKIDNLVEHVVLRCPRYADVRHKMWLNIWNNFDVDAHQWHKMASIGEELLLDILPLNYIIITDVLARENMDSF